MSLLRKIMFCESVYLKYILTETVRNPTDDIYLQRPCHGEYHHLFHELKSAEKDPVLFHSYTGMLPTTFFYIADVIRSEFKYKETNFQNPISVEERLLLTLRYLITGMRFRQLAFTFRISKSRVAIIVIEVCKAIWNKLVGIHMPQPTTEMFETIAKDFWEKWQFPNCFGALYLKHVRITRHPKSGSMHYCHHAYYSIGLLTLTDANYKFIMVNVGSFGKENDAGVFTNSTLHDSIESGQTKLPEPKILPGSSIKAPFVMVADEGFPMREYIVRPFPGPALLNSAENRTFNYRLSRARMVVECSYGAIHSKFNLLGKSIETNVENAVHIVKSITLLHNVIKDLEGGDVDNRPVVYSRGVLGGRRGRSPNAVSRLAAATRRTFAKYFKEHPSL